MRGKGAEEEGGRGGGGGKEEKTIYNMKRKSGHLLLALHHKTLAPCMCVDCLCIDAHY